MHLRLWFDKESFHCMLPLAQDPSCYEAQITLPETPCLLWYDFQVWQNGQFFWYGNAEDQLGGEGAFIYGSPRSYQITVYDPAFHTPDWVENAIFYQIFPDRFARSADVPLPAIKERTLHANWEEPPALCIDAETGDNIAHDFFGGNLRGIAEKLPYLVSLGVTALYINPIFHASTNHRFDTTDWLHIDPYLGSDEDFQSLCQAAAKLGIQIILDGVFSHAGNQSPIFLDAQQRQESPYRNWFTFEHWPDRYKSWWGFRTLPEINKHQPEVLHYFLSGKNAVVKNWVRKGASGWRIDVADELPMPYLRMMRNAVKAENKDAYIVGEVWEDASNKVAYEQMRSYCMGDTLDGVMNYPLRDAAIAFLLGTMDACQFKRKMDSLYENYPIPFAKGLLNVIGSHDRARILNILAEKDGEDLPREQRERLSLCENELLIAKKRLRLMLQLIIAMPGMPCIYYGDEAGMQGASDPYNRGTFPWQHIDEEQCLFFQDALQYRKSHSILASGTLQLEAPSTHVLVITRSHASQQHITFLNSAAIPAQVAHAGKLLTLDAFGYTHIMSSM